MTMSDVTALVAIVISAGALTLELRRWFDSGPKLHLSLIADGMLMPGDDGVAKLFITVTNRGDTPTTITHMICFAQWPWWQFWQRKPIMTGIVNSSIQPIPYEVGVNRSWMGRLNYDDTLDAYRAKGQLYVGVIANHSGRQYLKLVPPKRPDALKDVVGKG